MEPKQKPQSRRLTGLRFFAQPRPAEKSKGLRRSPKGSRTQQMRPLPPAVDASRPKLMDQEVRVEASRLKPKSVLHVYLKATHVAEDPTSFLVNDALGEALAKTQRTRQIGPTSTLTESLGSSGRVE